MMEGEDPPMALQSLFSLSEIVEMESILVELGEKSMEREFCQELASKLSSSAIRVGKSAVTCKERNLKPQTLSKFMDDDPSVQKEIAVLEKKVQDWFLYKLRGPLDRIEPSPLALNLIVDLSDSTISTTSNEGLQKPAGSKVMDLSELTFEARSLKDNAWYDVASILSYRITYNGVLEARVRFSGFAKDQDEWVSVRNAIRERSIPVEPSECHNIHVGDLTLCFQERAHQAVYCDAYILAIDRKEHDASDCTCLFLVRYNYDQSEEEVELSRICCRPLQDKKQLNQCNENPDALSISARSLWE